MPGSDGVSDGGRVCVTDGGGGPGESWSRDREGQESVRGRGRGPRYDEPN